MQTAELVGTSMQITAPASVAADETSTAVVTAEVYDYYGNPLQGAAVTFQTSQGTLGVTVPVYTDSSGQASDTLKSSSNLGGTATVTATSGTLSATANVALTGTGGGGSGGGSIVAPAISTTSLPAATIGQPYSQTIVTNGEGTAPYTFVVTTDSPPAGLTLDASTETVSGTPTTAGTYSFTVTVTDANNNTASESYSMTVNPASVTAPTTPPSQPSVNPTDISGNC